jgi:protein-disulfide isomerase
MDPAPAPYLIRINGHLGATVLSAFPALAPQQHGADTVLTGLLDRSALYGVLAEIEALGLDLLEIQKLTPDRRLMALNATPGDRQLALAPLDENVDHVRGSPASRLILEYGDYECPYSRQAFRAIEQIERQLGGNLRFAFRHFPLTRIHPHALAAAAAAEAAARQGRFWDMHELLFHRQRALEDGDLRGYAARLGLDVAAFDRDRASRTVLERVQRDLDSGLASGQVLGTPTLFIDGVVHRGGYDPPTLLAALAP